MLILILLQTYSLQAREDYELAFGQGDKVRILADKGYVRIRQNIREVVGNVIITHQTNAIYGEKATISMETGEVEVVGNVRYVAPLVTLYGSRLFINFKTGKMKINNARVLTESFVILGKELSRISENVFVGEDAEYTTCQDCPESWSVSGKKIHITVGQYIRAWHAQIKINGTVVMYIPYMVIPIKQDRETGLLFPYLNIVTDEGAWIRQPFFWAIGEHNDLTFTPAMLGKRGTSSEIQYRHVFGEKKWAEFNTLNGFDKIYEPYKKSKSLSGKTEFRHFTEYEHHFNFGNSFTHHFNYMDAKDIDVARDYDFHLKNRLLGSEFVRGGFLDFRTSWLNISTQAYFNRNLLTGSPVSFDDSYVQILPQLTFSILPISLFSSSWPLLNNVSIGAEADVTVFRQNGYNENNYIRNARRVSVKPYIDWSLGSLGPVNLKTNLTFDYQDYQFPYEEVEDTFSKYAFVSKSEASLTFSKIYGLARRELVAVEDIVLENEKESDSDIIGNIPSFKKKYANDSIKISRNSYKHGQNLRFKHYYIGGQRHRGSNKFYNQISNEDGLFDLIDPIRGREHRLSHATFKTELPLNNTVELQWNNTLIQKSPQDFNVFQNERYLKDNFSYSVISYFNVSQGYDLQAAETQTFTDSLTRLYVNFGFNLEKFTFSVQEYYFYANRGNILNLSLKKRFDFAHFGINLIYDSFTLPVSKYVMLSASVRPTDFIELSAKYTYDIERQKSRYTEYNLLYSPLSKCWQVNFRRSESELNLGPKYSFNLIFNFDGNSQSSLVKDAK